MEAMGVLLIKRAQEATAIQTFQLAAAVEAVKEVVEEAMAVAVAISISRLQAEPLR